MSTIAAPRLFPTLLAVGAVACLNSLSAATVSYTGPNSGSWSSPSSWSSGSLPAIGDEVSILTSGSTDLRVKGDTSYAQPGLLTLTIDGSGDGWAIVELSENLVVEYFTRVGDLGKGAIEQNGGNQDFNYLWIGASHFDATGRYTLKKGNVTADQIVVGNQGVGEFEHLKGKVTVEDWLIVGNFSDSDSAYTLTRGNLTVGIETVVGRSGYGVYEQTNGTADLGNLYVGHFLDGVGSVKQYGGKIHTDSVTIGKFGTGSIEQYGGAHSVTGDILLSGTFNGTASYAMDDGSLDVGGKIIVGGTSGQSEFIQTGGKVSVAGGIEIQHGAYRLHNATLSTRGLSVGAGAAFEAEGTESTIRTTGNISFSPTANITTRDATLIVGKGSNVSLSAIQSDTGATSLALSSTESWSAISLERNVTLSLQGTAGVDAVYVNRLDIGSRNPFRVESIIIGNGVNMYYNADLRANAYLKGGTYDLLDGGQLIPVHGDAVVSTGIFGGLTIQGSGSLVFSGSNTYGPGSEVLGGSLVVAGGQFAFELGEGGGTDQLQFFGEGDFLDITMGSFEFFDFTLVDSSFTAPGTFVFVGGDWQVYTAEVGEFEASGTLSESQFGGPSTSVVPEPASALLTLLGAAALFARRRSRSSQ